MRVIVVGLGVQGHKRRRFAGSDFVASVDPCAIPRPTSGICARFRSTHTTRRCFAFPTRRRSNCSVICVEHGKHVLVEKPLVAERRGGAHAAAAGRARQRRRALHRLQSPLRAALRAHARSGRIGRARPDLPLPHVLRQRHGAARAQFRLARSRRRRARRSRLAPARYCAVLVRRHRRRFLDRIGRLLREPQPRPCRVRGARRAPAAGIRNDAVELAQSFHLRHVRRERQRAHQLAVQMGTVRRSPTARAFCRAADRPRSR